MGRALAASIDGLVRVRQRGPVGHAVAILFIGATILVAEGGLLALDHGTHLLVALLMVSGTAILVGPGPALSGLVAGGGASIAISVAVVDGVLALPLTYLQIVIYLLAGLAIVGLAWLAPRSRRARMEAGMSDESGMSDAWATPVGPPPRLVEPLTERELEVLRLAASGIAVDAIGSRLYLSPNTVKTHLTHAYAKLGVRGRSDAIRAALHFGCLTPADICPHRYPPRDDGTAGSKEAAHRNR